jgi:hypothetical protein
MPSSSDPLLLWCSSHESLGAEEIPLLLEAGFRVVPLNLNFWTQEYDATLDATICPAWRESVALPPDVVRALQWVRICQPDKHPAFAPDDLALLARHVDAVYVTVFPNVAIRLAEEFSRTVIFRVFGQAGLSTYSKIAAGYGVPTALVNGLPNFIWCPILSTLQDLEDEQLVRNTQPLRAFVTPARLGGERWSAAKSEPYVVDTIPRLHTEFYLENYRRFIADHGELPLKILGGNEPRGGVLDDSRIVGRLPPAEYYAAASRARLSIYHGRARDHLHYHPLEFMTLGVPVLFHRGTALAAEAELIGVSAAQLAEAGMFSHADEANCIARAALVDPEVGAAIAAKQRFFLERIFSRPAALEQAIWLRTLVLQRAARVRAAAATSSKTRSIFQLFRRN